MVPQAPRGRTRRVGAKAIALPPPRVALGSPAAVTGLPAGDQTGDLRSRSYRIFMFLMETL